MNKKRLMFRPAMGVVLLAMIFSLAPLSQAASAGYVRGRVSLSGRSARSVWVIVRQNGVEKGRSLTGDDGKYYIANLPQGLFEIVVVRGKSQLCSRQLQLAGNASYDISI